MNVVFRVDSSEIIGSGHVMRCLTLAVALRDSGVAIEFITRDHPGNLNEYIKGKGFKTHLLTNQEIPESLHKLSGYEQWLGVTQEVDAAQTIEAVEGKDPDWIIIDHYALDHEWEVRLRSYTGKVMVIGDLANRNHECDLLLDQNMFEDMSVRYQGRIPEKCVQLLGPKYALLQPDYAELRKQIAARKAPLKFLLIFFGGADRRNLTGLTLSALEQINIPFERVDVVISRKSPHYEQVKDQVMCSSTIRLHSDLPSLAPLMIIADLAIGGGGTANWERICLGLPSLVITLSENQRIVCPDLHNMNLIEWVGDVETIQIDQISSGIQRALSLDDIKNWSERCMAVCSGEGAALVADTMLEISTGR